MVKRRFSLLLVALAVVVAACGDSGSTATSGNPSATVSASTTQAGTVPISAVPPPPQSYSEVEAEHDAATSAILAEGRAVADEFLAGDIEAIHARLDAPFAAQLSVDDLRTGRDELVAQAPLGDRGTDRAVQASPSRRLYGAELEWGEQILAMTVVFDAAGEISGLGLSPQSALPPDPAAGYVSEVTYRLPFDGTWFVFWGGDTETENRHVVAQDQRHALDILLWKDGGTHAGDGTANEDYWAYGQPVLAPAAGTVVTTVDGLADQTPQVGSDPTNPAGNHVVIEVASGEYVLIAHLQPGSVMVGDGDVVVSGQQVGLVGNSGNTTEPHIHIHVQDRPGFDPQAMGLPLEFTEYLANGQPVGSDQPVGGQFVANRG
jgi:murein DD-endopeptidase MepM/ murein hydrolase activator NlpD